MRVRNVSTEHDWRFGKSNNDYVTGAFAVAIDIKMRLYEWYNDCFFALQKGIDWSRRLGSHNQKLFLDSDIRRVISGTNGVISITNFNSAINNRKYSCSCQIEQQYSTDLIPVNFEMGV